MDVLASVADHAQRHPGRLAHTWAGGSLTWGELWERSGRLAGALAAEIGHRGTPVVVHAHKQSLALVCMLACVRAGLPYVYLGYWVPGSRKMGYKAKFGALEIYKGGRWQELGDPADHSPETHPLSVDPIAEQVARISLPDTR